MEHIDTHTFKYRLGLEAKDIITGYTGIIYAQVKFLTGCDNYKLLPKELSKDGQIQEGQMFDENRIEIVGEGVVLPGSNIPQPAQQPAASTTPKGGPQDPIGPQRSL